MRILSSNQTGLAEGALRAIAMLRLGLSTEAIEKIMAFVARPENEQLRFWVAAAAPGWDAPQVQEFLRDCRRSASKETRRSRSSCP